MKPTQQEIIELARELRRIANPNESRIYQHERGKLFEAARMLERFGAGGGEPVATVVDSLRGYNVISYSCDDINALPPGTNLYTHPSHTDLRAEYLRGLEDAAKVADDDANVVDGRGYYDQLGDAKLTAANIRNAIEALKGKQ